jgi:formylglycine-generating enzyme required for sulfatase activity/tetratricopeptide (TPR) repeat protein
MTLIRIEPGLFHPGDYEHPASWGGPLQTVVLTRPFFMADEALTAKCYRRFLDSDDHPAGETLAAGSRPTEPNPPTANLDWHKPLLSQGLANVDWASAIRFCNWLSRAEGRTPCYRLDASGRGLGLTCDFRANGYRLQTDAEWEYVFRCGTRTRFVTGDDVTRMLDYGRVFATDVGVGKMFYPNPWGLFDLLGNWWQMCWDAGYPRSVSGLAMNPVGTVGVQCSIRGGSFDAGTWHLHGSLRYEVGAECTQLIRLVCGPLEAGAEPDEKTAALGILTRSLEHAPESRPQVWVERGQLYAELGQWKEAAADFTRACQLPGATAAPWARQALVRWQLGDYEGHRKACGEMLKRLAKSDDLDTVAWAASACTVSAEPAADLAPLARALERQAARQPDACRPHHRLGAVYYRSGRFADAVRELDRARQLHAKTDGGLTQDWLLLAMAHHRLGHAAEARRWLGRAILRLHAAAARRWLDRMAPQLHDGASSQPWHERLEVETLRREAEALLNE